MFRWMLLCVLTCCSQALAQETSVGTTIDYELQIKTVLGERCYACHGAFKQEADLRVDTVRAMREREAGPIIAPKNSAASILYQRVTETNPELRMPPEGKPLTSEQISALRLWIEQGANAPMDEPPQADPRMHWAFLPIRRPHRDSSRSMIPASESESSSHPVDQLLRPMQQQMDVFPLTKADPPTLIRRLYLDLLGIPPTPQEVDAFVADESPMAYESLVDSVLERPEYGERWARHWMDVWRYSDWYGRRNVPDVMNSYPQIWRWRDWIVNSLNRDKGYDQMIREMLAADEIHPTEQETLVATGFLVRNWYKWNYETWMKDNVEHTAKAFLGLTMNCAMCHDHKYDPISQEDYFRFRAFFEPLELRHERIAGLTDPGPFKKYVYAESYGPIPNGAIRVFDEKLDAKTWMFRGGDARNRMEEKGPIEPSPPISLMSQPFSIQPISLPSAVSYPGLRSDLRNEEKERAHRHLEEARRKQRETHDNYQRSVNAGESPDANKPENADPIASTNSVSDLLWQMRLADADLAVANANQRSVECRLDADEARFLRTDIGPERQREIAQQAHLAEKLLSYEQALRANVQSEWNFAKALRLPIESLSKDAATRGQASTSIDQVKVDQAKQAVDLARQQLDAARQNLTTVDTTYTAFSAQYPTSSTGRRTALANWIVDSKNPLTARVAVNQIWLRHFGQALVDSTDNFGVQGKRPTHPELLDWLAAEFMENNWSMKHLHRVLVTSEAYQRSSNPNLIAHPNLSHDRDNRSYWRFPIRRMEAEVIRDSLLFTSHLLDQSLGGAELDMNQWSTTFRRSLYYSSHGETRMQFLETFDGPNVNECYRRSSTILPQQALAMTNGELSVHCGRSLAAKLDTGEGEGTSDRVLNDHAFVDAAFRQVLGRAATPKEMELAIQFLIDQKGLLSRIPEEQRQRQGIAAVAKASSDLARRARENLVISLYSHNDFVTIR